MVGAIAGSSKREPITVGKPAEFMLDNIAKTFNLQRQQICMVGDRLDTDILFGKNGGLTTCLVLSGERGKTQRHVCSDVLHTSVLWGCLTVSMLQQVPAAPTGFQHLLCAATLYVPVMMTAV